MDKKTSPFPPLPQGTYDCAPIEDGYQPSESFYHFYYCGTPYRAKLVAPAAVGNGEKAKAMPMTEAAWTAGYCASPDTMAKGEALGDANPSPACSGDQLSIIERVIDQWKERLGGKLLDEAEKLAKTSFSIGREKGIAHALKTFGLNVDRSGLNARIQELQKELAGRDFVNKQLQQTVDHQTDAIADLRRHIKAVDAVNSQLNAKIKELRDNILSATMDVNWLWKKHGSQP